MTDRTDDKDAEAAKGDIEEQVDEAEDKGYFGTKVDPIPNEEYTLTTGPDSPSAIPGPQINIADLAEED